MPRADACALPDIPPSAIAWLRALDPESEICLQRKGGKVYEDLESFSTSPIPGMTVKQVAKSVGDDVDTNGNGYFCMMVDDDKKGRFSWYAYMPETKLADAAADMDPFARRALTLLDHVTNNFARLLEKFPAMADAMVDTTKAAADSQKDVIEQLREAAAESAEVTIAALEEERKAAREKTGLELFQQWMDKAPKADATTQGLLQHLMVRLEPSDLNILREDDDGKELLAAKTPMGFRDAAVRTAKRFFSGDLVLSDEASERLAEWLPTIVKFGADDDDKPKAVESE